MSAYETRAMIIALMAEQHIAARQLGERLGCTEEYLSAVLGGRGPLTGSQVAAIALVLDVDPRELTGRATARCIDCGAVMPGTHRYNCPTLGPDLLLDGCTCGGIGNTGSHRPYCAWSAQVAVAVSV